MLAEVEAGLQKRWSPEQSSAKLKVDYPDDLEMRISHETIYPSLFVQSRGELRRELAACLRTARKTRKPQGRVQTRAQIIVDGTPALFITAGEHDGLWAGVRRHGQLTLTIVAGGASPEAVELEPLADPRAQLLGPEQ